MLLQMFELSWLAISPVDKKLWFSGKANTIYEDEDVHYYKFVEKHVLTSAMGCMRVV